jgi:hypothetical protein
MPWPMSGAEEIIANDSFKKAACRPIGVAVFSVLYSRNSSNEWWTCSRKLGQVNQNATLQRCSQDECSQYASPAKQPPTEQTSEYGSDDKDNTAEHRNKQKISKKETGNRNKQKAANIVA